MKPVYLWRDSIDQGADRVAGKYNPFRPDKTAPPGMFAGRLEEIRYIQGCLRQTKNGNPKHFLLTGERGIGKSSLFLVEQLSARGRIKAQNGEEFNFLVLNVKLRKEDTFVDIITRVSRSLKKESEKLDILGSLILKSFEFISRIEAGGIRIHPSAESQQQNECFNSLMDDLEETVHKIDGLLDGILILIDEADAPPAESNLGLFCKLLTEEMAVRETDYVCLGLAGLPHISSRLRGSHESSIRIFHTLDLKPLEAGERRQVIRLGLDDANGKNPTEVRIDAEAEGLICDFSEGYPHFLQEFAYCAFERDVDNNIDVNDFLDSLFSENGAFDQLGAKYFKKPYKAPGSDDYRQVLHIMADKLDGWISRKEIIENSGLKGGTVDNALRALKAKDIIVQDETRQGYYRLPTRSFATWINIQKKASEAETA